MMFEYQAEDGEVITREGSMHNPPDIGKQIKVKGKAYKRIYSVPGGKDIKLTTFVQPDARVTSISQPRYWRDADTGEPFAPGYDKDGRPQYESYRQMNEYIAKANDHGEQVQHDGSFGRSSREG